MIVAQNELTLLLFFILIILLAPFMPNRTLLMFDNMIVRIASILLLLFAISQGPSAGLIGLVAIGVVYLERNRRKVAAAQELLNKMEVTETNATVQELAIPQKTVPVHSFEEAEDISLHFLPGEHVGSDEFHPVSGSESLNDKLVLARVPNGSHAAEVFESAGLAPNL
jgi:hypothetical protein